MFEYFFRKHGYILVSAFILIGGFILSSCSKRSYDYSIFPRNGVLTGEMKDNKKLYLIRENGEGNFIGTGFIYQGSAIVDRFSFLADTLGGCSIRMIDSTLIETKAKLRIRESQGYLILNMKKNTEYGIKAQKVILNCVEIRDGKEKCVERYKEVLFDSIVSYKDVQYGMADGFYTSEPVDDIPHGEYDPLFKIIVRKLGKTMQKPEQLPLLMDIYTPYGDFSQKRPVFLYLHGGAFFFGDKENILQKNITDYLVKRGYVVASINYRLGSTLLGLEAIERTIHCGAQDVRAALRYLKHNCERWGIDPDQIYLGGSSAGAIISLTSAFMDDDEVYESTQETFLRRGLGGLNDSGNDLKEDVRIAGLVAMWGAISDLDLIDKEDAYFPTLLFHGTDDDIVRCDKGLPFKDQLGERLYDKVSSSWQLYGSESIYERMSQNEMKVRYVPFQGYGHEPQVDPDGTYNHNMEVINTELTNFMFDSFIKCYFNYTLSGDANVGADDAFSVYAIDEAPALGLKWSVDGGFILDELGTSVRVVWFRDTDRGKIAACFTDENGHSCRKEMVVEIMPQEGNFLNQDVD